MKEEVGLGTTIDAVVYDGIIRHKDTIVLTTPENVITTKIRSLLKPKALEEIREAKNVLRRWMK